MTNEGNELYCTGLFNASITLLSQPVHTAQTACNYVLNYARDCDRATEGDALVILQHAERLEKAAAVLRKAAARRSSGSGKPIALSSTCSTPNVRR